MSNCSKRERGARERRTNIQQQPNHKIIASFSTTIYPTNTKRTIRHLPSLCYICPQVGQRNEPSLGRWMENFVLPRMAAYICRTFIYRGVHGIFYELLRIWSSKRFYDGPDSDIISTMITSNDVNVEDILGKDKLKS